MKAGPRTASAPQKTSHDLVNTLVLDLFTTLNGIKYENATEDNQRAQLFFYYNATANNIAKTKFFTLRTYLFNEYGIRHFFDSVTIKTDDNFRIRNNLQIPFSKTLFIQAGVDVKSQLWKTYAYRPDTSSGDYEAYLYTDYYSPGYTLYSFGASFHFLQDASVDLGLIGGKITRIRNEQIFDTRGSKKLYGLARGERKKVDWGVNLQVSVPPKLFGRHFGWELSGTLFAPRQGIGRLRSYTADANNVLHYIFFRHMRLTLRTQLLYDESVQEKIFIMNQLSLGFYLSNKL